MLLNAPLSKVLRNVVAYVNFLLSVKTELRTVYDEDTLLVQRRRDD